MTALETPSPDAPAEEWGALAVSIPGFPCHSVAQRRGMVGWLFGESADVDWPVDGLRAMFVVEKGVTLYQVVEPGGYPQHRMRNGRHEFIPDPDHPATAGWLLALHSDSPGWHWVEVDREQYGYRLCSWLGRGHEVKRGPLARNPGRACIAAAAAIGRWLGGAS